METEKYKVLLKVIETGNFTKSANELGLTQSAVSYIIQSLESDLGMTLLIRGKRESTVNPCVYELLPYIKELLQAENKIIQTASQINGLEQGTLQIGCFTSVSIHWLPQLLKGFSQKYPHIQINLIDGSYEQIEAWILSGSVDCGFITIPAHENIESINLYTEKLVAVLPKSHPLACKKELSLHDLTNETFILPGEGMNYNLGELLKEHHAKINIRYSVKDDYITISFVKNGLGISILPELVLKDFKEEIAICELQESAYRTLGLGTKSIPMCSPVCKHFISYVQETFKA